MPADKPMPSCLLAHPTTARGWCHAVAMPWAPTRDRSQMWAMAGPWSLEPEIGVLSFTGPQIDILSRVTSILFILNESISLQEQRNKFPCHVYFSQTWWSPWSRTKVCSGPRAFCWLSTGLSVYNVISQVFVWKWFVTLIFPLRITHPLHSLQQKLHRDGSSEVRWATVMLQMGRYVIPTLLVVPHKGKKASREAWKKTDQEAVHLLSLQVLIHPQT